ncbi:MFS transporter [Thalassotalea mangrovi]|uniref:MFS transporter n=1 Tax=Thalassotalea mangrovi TaxID=2572245 RepID=A0A4U1B6J6_9GAMM|nr:MFS transporter [Thalassotalea mangrovi]TKB46070.1 MFS transporter [Thalassotalea mangrovi]
MTTQAAENKYLFIQVNEGVSGWNMSVFYLTCIASILLGTFINAFQPFLFTEVMNIPKAEHGMVSGKLNFWGEMAIIASVGVWGAVSDKIGRRTVMVSGFALIALALYLYPGAASVNELVVYRMVYGVGIAAATCMIVTLLADYAVNKSRGKAAGLQGVCNGIGAMVALFLLLRLPSVFQSNGWSVVDSGFATYYVAVGLAVVVGLISLRGLKSHEKIEHEQKPGLATLMVDGVKAAKDPGIALAYGAAFVSRANLSIVGAFMTLWLSNYGTSADVGMSAADSLKKAGMFVGIAQGVALLTAPLFGLLTDKINRVNALAVACLLTFIGYAGTYFVTDPFGGFMIAIVIVVGLSEIGAIITSGVLISQQTAEKNRGAVIGIFNLCGAIGILVSSVIGGYLFDHWKNAGPFVFVGFCGLIVFIWALVVKNKVVPHAEQSQS